MYPHGVLEAFNRERRKGKRRRHREGGREEKKEGERGAKWLGGILTHIVASHPLKQSL